jgi:hypothetical protein
MKAGPSEQAFPSVKHERFYIRMAKGLHGITGRILQLTNKSSVRGGAFKYKEKNLEVLYTTKLWPLSYE